MKVTLTKHFNRFVAEKLKSGRYANASEVVHAGLRLLEEVEQNTVFIPDLEAELLRGLESPASPLTRTDWEEVRKRGRARIAKLKAA